MKVEFVVDGVEEGSGEEGGEVREEHKQKRRGFQQDRLGAVSHCSYSLRRLGCRLLYLPSGENGNEWWKSRARLLMLMKPSLNS
ncbi:hypothetical protein SASPL_146621 [Salvia splendens]|uniref:Uncharacterized protein n=1 Tax=Salvia splendens TaxID=180675 RepID=A0A8X8WDM4_SALSN|nr:hypothetical protein SASPL_146621 [Salvia splendens]